MYRIATFLVGHSWGDFPRMVDALTVLLLTWNQAFYRYGPFDQDQLEKFLRSNWQVLEAYRTRDLTSWNPSDEATVPRLFIELTSALASVRKAGARALSPVSAAKGLHLLSPSFFPLWDARIAKAYRCDYSYQPARAYVRFCEIARFQLGYMGENASATREKSPLKLLDEYNYARFTQGWIQRAGAT